MSAPGEVAGDQLRAIVERIERIEEEIQQLNEDKKEIYLEAKGNGFDVKILRQVVRIRKQDAKERDEQETMLDLYLQAIGGAAVKSAGERKTGSRRAKAPQQDAVALA